MSYLGIGQSISAGSNRGTGLFLCSLSCSTKTGKDSFAEVPKRQKEGNV
jgi:hypothetical protein